MAREASAAVPVSAGSVQKISCHIVVKQSGQSDINHCFANVPFPSSMLVQRPSALCTTPLALITQLQQQLAYLSSQNIAIDPTICAILNQEHPLSNDISVATTRTPIFEEQRYRGFLYGYRQLGSFPGSSYMSPGLEFDDVIDFDSLQSKAKFSRGNRSSSAASLARCFYVMEHIVTSLGLDPGTLKSSKTFAVGDSQVTIAGSDVLALFGWVGTTFSKKRGLFKQAKIVAHCSWKGDTPDKADTPAEEMYKTYLGIRYLWAEHGPLANFTSLLPSAVAQGEEKLAAELKQGDLERRCLLLHDQYTE